MISTKFNAPWHPLKETWVGKSYSPEFYEPIKNSRIRESLQKIAQETEDDYQNLISILKRFGVTVQRPEIKKDLNIMHYVDNSGNIDYRSSKSFTLIPRPPMQPRDSLLVVGEKIFLTNEEAQWFYPGSVPLLKQFDAPLITVIGQHLIVDCREHSWLADYVAGICPDRTVIKVTIGGHNDAVFCPVKPGLIISTYHHENYKQSFPGWTVKFIENQSWNAIPDWRKFKHSNVGKWWSPESENNPEFVDFVDTWLNNWLGYVEETVFDVNMLQIDENTVIVNNYNKDMFDFFKIHNVEPIIASFRHRFFWDGGIHCITGDIYREGENETYITTRG